MFYITAGSRVGTSPWCNLELPEGEIIWKDEPWKQKLPMSCSHMFFTFSVFLAFVQLILGFMRDALRERQRVVNLSLR